MKKFLLVILILTIAATISLISINCKTATGAHPKVLWYKMNGIEWNEEKEKAQIIIDPIQPEIDELTSDELTQIVVDKWGSIFFISAIKRNDLFEGFSQWRGCPGIFIY